MSNAARKARKAAGIQFQHPVKTPTPLQERARFEWLQPKKVFEQLVLRGMLADQAKAGQTYVQMARNGRIVQRRLSGRR